jgi:hypothetical protein
MVSPAYFALGLPGQEQDLSHGARIASTEGGAPLTPAIIHLQVDTSTLDWMSALSSSMALSLVYNYLGGAIGPGDGWERLRHDPSALPPSCPLSPPRWSCARITSRGCCRLDMTRVSVVTTGTARLRWSVDPGGLFPHVVQQEHSASDAAVGMGHAGSGAHTDYRCSAVISPRCRQKKPPRPGQEHGVVASNIIGPIKNPHRKALFIPHSSSLVTRAAGPRFL